MDQLAISQPNGRTVIRNIKQYFIQTREGASSLFSTIDTIQSALLAPQINSLSTFYTCTSKAQFTYNAEYTVRVQTIYYSGEIRNSNEVQFTTPREAGKVLQRIPIVPQLWYNKEID
ncbi:MAG: hypothetical protein V1799_15305 [bacterium]